MDVKAIDVCIVNGFRLTEYQVFNDDDIVKTYFNIRDEQGLVFGHNYNDVETPLNIMLGMWATEVITIPTTVSRQSI